MNVQTMTPFLIGVLILDFLLQLLSKTVLFGKFNTGVSFGLVPGLGRIIAVVFYVLFLVTVFKLPKRNLGVLFLVIGGMGNLLARVLWGGVWDYLTLPGLPFWFNLSDVMISTGVILYLTSYSFVSTRRH